MTDVYIVRVNSNTDWAPIAGPFRGYNYGVQYIEMLPKEEQGMYGNASRYQLAKMKLYPNNKAGEAKLLADMEMPGLAAPFAAALGRSSFFAGFPAENVAEAQKVLDEQKQKTPLV